MKRLGWIERGQTITCNNGHVIATAYERAEIGVGVNIWSKDWSNRLFWRYRAPEVGVSCTCPLCDGFWFLREIRSSPWWVPKFLHDGPHWETWICVDGKWDRPLPENVKGYLDRHLFQTTWSKSDGS